VACEPLTGSLPDQAPEAVQAVALVAFQLSVELVLVSTVLGLAAMVTMGAGALTETVADCVALPPPPVQVNVYVAFAVSAPEDCEPLTAFVPAQAPEAVHAVAFCVDHVSVDVAPELMVLGLALIVISGGSEETVTVADWVAEPPGPVQVSEYSVVLGRAPVDQVPLVATVPFQAPDEVHAVAFCELQVNSDMPPLATVVGEAVSVTVGVEETTTTSADCEADPPGPVQVSV